jgi:hypothetical protein
MLHTIITCRTFGLLSPIVAFATIERFFEKRFDLKRRESGKEEEARLLTKRV